MPQRKKNAPSRGLVRKRGNSFEIAVYNGLDPLTGKRSYLRESTTDEEQVPGIINRLCAQVDDRRSAETKGALRTVMEKWFELADLDVDTRKSYRVYMDRYIDPALGDQPVSKVDAQTLETFYAQLRRCRRRCDGKPFVEHRTEEPHECRVIRHRRPPGRPPRDGYPPHDCVDAGCTVTECQEHECQPLSDATILKIHYIFSGTFAAAVRWKWMNSNPADVAKKPQQPTPDPDPPTPEEASRIVNAAWQRDKTWGTLVWLVMVTGMRRSELLALRWRDFDRERGKLSIYSTKTHRRRKISLDETTVQIITEHYQRYEERMRELGAPVNSGAFIFSARPESDRPYNRSYVSHRYTKTCKDLGIDSHLHALRHYNATELLQAGTDIRTVAGRLGHGGGGVTTLRVYAAWREDADREAANVLGSKIQRPPSSE